VHQRKIFAARLPRIRFGKEDHALGERVKCPKCGGAMEYGTTSGDFRILKSGDLVGDRASAFYCLKCGYVELYKEASTKEPQRWRPRQEELEQAPQGEKPQKPQEEEPSQRPDKRLIR